MGLLIELESFPILWDGDRLSIDDCVTFWHERAPAAIEPCGPAPPDAEGMTMATPTDEYEAIRRMTPERKLAVMRSLIRQAYELKAAGIRAAHPELSEEEVRSRARELVAGDRS